jgi:hypothetical protein
VNQIVPEKLVFFPPKYFVREDARKLYYKQQTEQEASGSWPRKRGRKAGSLALVPKFIVTWIRTFAS